MPPESAAAQQAPIPSEQVMKEYDFPLSQEDFATKGKEAAALQETLTALEAEFSDVKKDFKARIAQLELELHKTLDEIRLGKHLRRVSCEMRRNFDKFEVDYIHNGAIMETRPMDAEERQMELGDVEEEERAPQGKEAAWKD